jgi:hypothetical protein
VPEDEQTSKHGGGGRYNAILEFKRGAKIKKIDEKEKEKENEKKERKKKVSIKKK